MFGTKKEVELEKKSRECAKSLKETLVIFPGTLSDYEIFRGYEVEIIDTNRLNKGVNHSELTKYSEYEGEDVQELRIHLLSKGIETILVQSHEISSSLGSGGACVEGKYYGLPVRRKPVQ